MVTSLVYVQERQLAGQGEKSAVFSEFNPDTNKYYVYSNDLRLQGLYDTADEADAFVKQFNSSIPYGPSKYDKYQLPGGENYREILLTLPEAMPNTSIEIQRFTKRMEAMRELQNEFANAGDMEKAISFAQKADDLQAHIRQLEKIPVTKQTENYQSSHFDEPNILAHIRVNDRVDADGKKMLLIEEIQSDWHQAGREKGYRKQGDKQALEAESKAIGDERNRLVKELSEQEKQNGFVSTEGQQQWDAFKEKENLFKQKYKDFSSQAPDAPFKDTWYQLALKRVLKHAADNGYERVGLTTGRQQAERFDLSKQVDELLYKKNEDGTYRLSAQAGGRGNMMGEAIPENKLSDYVGTMKFDIVKTFGL